MAIIEMGKFGGWHVHRGNSVNSGFKELKWAIAFLTAFGCRDYIVLDKEGNELTA